MRNAVYLSSTSEVKIYSMLDERHSVPPKHERRLQAVLPLFRGEPVVQVSRQSGIGRSDLYKFRAQALSNWALQNLKLRCDAIRSAASSSVGP
jgi:hypothetical protein